MIYCMAGIVLLMVYNAVLTFYIILIIEKHNRLSRSVRDAWDRILRLDGRDGWGRLEKPFVLSAHYTLGTDLAANKTTPPSNPTALGQ